MEEPKKKWVPTNEPTFDLSPANLFHALEASVKTEGLSDAQKLYLRSTLLSIASNSVPVMEEKARMEGGMEARMISPAHSVGRMSLYEPGLYDLIEKGDVQNIRNIVQNQTITWTAHPNFSRSEALVAKSREIIGELGDLSVQNMHAIARTGEIPPSVKHMLSDLTPLLAPRTKRSREDELRETTLNTIPVSMEGATRQVALIKERREMVGGKKLEFNNIDQLKAVAAMLPEYNSWFVDGDGKRSAHVYDTEVSLPAIKRVTYEQYLKNLDRMPAEMDGFSATLWKRKLQAQADIFKGVEKLASDRLNALNAVHAANDEYNADPGDAEAARKLRQARVAASPVSLAYMKELNRTVDIGDGPIRIKDLLKKDTVKEMREQLAEGLQKVYNHDVRLDASAQAAAEDLFIKAERYGNFAVHLQRRENAAQYRMVFDYLLEQSHSEVKSAVFNGLKSQEKYAGLKIDEIEARLDNPVFYSDAIAALAKSALDPNDSTTRDYIQKVYKGLAQKLEKELKDNAVNTTVKPLQYRELLALDDLGHFNMARLYPEAFKAGFVVAEFAQPDSDILKKGDKDAIREDVKQRAAADMMLQLTFASAMKVPDIKIIPLHEDPATIQYVQEAQGALREGVIKDYLVRVAGGDSPENAEANAVRYLNDRQQPEIMSAYQYLQRFGVTDEELKSKHLNPDALKKTRVLLGPPDMEACSDIGKRATIMGSELVEQSIREKAIAAARYPVTVGDTDYIIVKPKYLGQGGSIARSTNVPIDAVQSTIQGEHLNNQTAQSLAYESHNRMLARWYMAQDAIRNDLVADEGHRTELLKVAGGAAFHVGNILGHKGYGIKPEEAQMMFKAIDDRIASTRDDDRYNDFLAVYGEKAPNYSARPDNKTGKKETFDSGRAIGIAAKEQGIYSNIIGMASIFDKRRSPEKVRQWIQSDSFMQQEMTAAAVTVNMVDLEDKWKRGGVEYKENRGVVSLTKDGTTVSLKELLKAYNGADANGQKIKEYKSGKTTFGAADLVMANLTEQSFKLSKGLKEVYGVNELAELFHPAHRETIKAYKDLQKEILKTTQDKSLSKADMELAQGAYYVLAEGGGIYPSSGLLERDISQRPMV